MNLPRIRPAAHRLLPLILVGATGTASALDILPGRDGNFITAWQVAGPLPTRSVPELLASPLDGPRWSTLAGNDPYVDAGKARRAKKGQSTLFAIVLRNDTRAPIDATLHAGSDGHLQVWLDGHAIAGNEKPYLALWDDLPVPLRVEPGSHVLVLETRAKAATAASWRVVARILDARGALPAGLALALPASVDAQAATIAADACRMRVERTPTPTGYRASIEVSATGSLPKGAPAAPWSLTLSGQAAVATGQCGQPARTVDLKLERDGDRTLTLAVGPRKALVERIGYRKAWHVALDEAAANFTRAKGLDRGALDSLQWNLEELQRLVVENIKDTKWLDEQIGRVGQWMARAAGGHDPLKTERGDFYRAYRSPYDGRLQHYSVHIPPRYKGERWPLVLGMHGIGSGTHYTLRRVLGRDRDKEGGEADGKPMIRGNMPVLPDLGVLTASAWGYHNSAYWFYGEDDVMRVISEMKRAYAVDESRVYLTGLSLGGLGTYHIGHHYADQFAALGPLGGFSSIKLYQEIRKHPKTPWETVLIEQRDATSYAENGRHTPMRVVHGQFDAPNHAKAMTKRYDALGYRYELDIPPLPHDVWQYAYGEKQLVQWLKRWTRPPAPDEIVWKTQSYRYTKAYWARVDWIDDYTKPALFRLKVSPEGGRIVFSALQNLRGLSLDLSKPDLAPGTTEIVLPGGVILRTSARGAVHLRREDDTWQLAESSVPPAGWKRPGVSGPLDDVMFEPHVFVAGTQDPAQTDLNRRLIEEDRRYIRHIDHEIQFPALDDSTLTDADLSAKNLVVYGNPKSNLVLRKALATGKVPLRFEDDGLIVGRRRFQGADVGVKLIVPNPWNPERYLVVVAGVTRRGTLLSRHLPRFLPDVIVYDERVSTRYTGRILVDRPVLFGGFFGSDWSLPPELR